MRLLLFGHFSHTGFGRVTEALGERFLKAGHDVRVMAMNHRGEPVKGPLNARVWPTSVLEKYVQDPCGAAAGSSERMIKFRFPIA